MTQLIVNSNQLLPNNKLTLQPDEAHYLVHVLQLQPNNSIDIHDNIKKQYKTTITNPNTLQLKTHKNLPTLPKPTIHLTFVPIQKKQINILLKKTTKLNISTLHPIFSKQNVHQTNKNHQH